MKYMYEYYIDFQRVSPAAPGGTNGENGSKFDSAACSGCSGQGSSYAVCLASIKYHKAIPGAGGVPVAVEYVHAAQLSITIVQLGHTIFSEKIFRHTIN